MTGSVIAILDELWRLAQNFTQIVDMIHMFRFSRRWYSRNPWFVNPLLMTTQCARRWYRLSTDTTFLEKRKKSIMYFLMKHYAQIKKSITVYYRWDWKTKKRLYCHYDKKIHLLKVRFFSECLMTWKARSVGEWSLTYCAFLWIVKYKFSCDDDYISTLR